jgi:hypothetical protein
MMPVRSYRDLIVWQKAMAPAALCYVLVMTEDGQQLRSLIRAPQDKEAV